MHYSAFDGWALRGSDLRLTALPRAITELEESPRKADMKVGERNMGGQELKRSPTIANFYLRY